MKLRATLFALALPAAVVAGTLAYGHRDLTEAATQTWQAPPPPVEGPAELPVAREAVLRLLTDDGAPAAGAEVAVLEPSLAQLVADAEGRVTLRAWADGYFRLFAWAPGHEVLGPVSFAAPPEDGLRLTRMRHPGLSRPEPLQETERSLRLRRADDGTPVPGALVLGVPATSPDAAPVVGFSDGEGVVTLRGLPEGAALFRVYSPGLPPEPAWLLGEASGGELALRCAELLVDQLEPGAVLSGERLDVPAPLPSRLVPPDGAVLHTALPPGRYRLRVGEREWTVELGVD